MVEIQNLKLPITRSEAQRKSGHYCCFAKKIHLLVTTPIVDWSRLPAKLIVIEAAEIWPS
jgi:hypothetical protein